MDDLEHVVEAARAAIIRVWHVEIAPVFLVEAAEQAELFPSIEGGGHLFERGEVALVHGQDEVGVVKILRLELARPRGQLKAIFPGRLHHPFVRPFADVPVAHAGGRGENFVLKALPRHQGLEHPLGQRGAADVAEADEADLDHHTISMIDLERICV